MTGPRGRLVRWLWLAAVVVGAARAEPVKFPAVPSSACELPPLKVIPIEGVVLDQSNCDVIFNKEDYDLQPEQVAFPKAVDAKTYTLLMIDPDAPNHPQGNYYLHWIVANIPGSDLATGKVSGGTVVASYRGPGPPKNTGDHRYLFLVFEQGSTPLTLSEPKRPQFNLASWIQSVGSLSGPVAGVQFKAHF